MVDQIYLLNTQNMASPQHFTKKRLCCSRNPLYNRLGSRFWVNETSQFSERYSDQMQAAMKQKSLLMLEHT